MSDSCVISSDGTFRDCKSCRGSISLEWVSFLSQGNRSHPSLTTYVPSPRTNLLLPLSNMLKPSPLRWLRPHPIPFRSRQTPTPLHFRNSMFLNPFLNSPNITALCHVLKFANGSGDCLIQWCGMMPTSALHMMFCRSISMQCSVAEKEVVSQMHAQIREERGVGWEEEGV